MARILISYFSKTGHTKLMAEEVAKGASLEGCDVALKAVSDTSVDDMRDADAVVFGSPTYYGGPASELKLLIDQSVKYHGSLEGKVGGAFASAGMLGGGVETTVRALLDALLIHGMVVIGSPRIAHYGPVSIGNPDDKAREECRTYGERLAKLTLKLTTK